MIMGGVAVQFWTRGRTTRDLDITTFLKNVEVGRFQKLMQQKGFKPRQPQTSFHPKELLLFSFKPTGLELELEFDVTLATTAYQKVALERAILLPWFGRKVRVMAAEDLILHKLLANRPLDIFDVQETLKEQKGNLDNQYLQRWVKQMNLTQQFNKIR